MESERELLSRMSVANYENARSRKVSFDNTTSERKEDVWVAYKLLGAKTAPADSARSDLSEEAERQEGGSGNRQSCSPGLQTKTAESVSGCTIKLKGKSRRD